MSHSWILKFQDDPLLEASETMCSAYLVYHLSNLRNLEGYLSRRIYLKLQTGGPRTIGSTGKGIKRPKCVAQKPPKEGQPDSKVKRSQPMRFGLWRARSYPFPLVLLYFRRWFTIGATAHLCFPLIFFSSLLDNVLRSTAMQRCVAGRHQQHPGISGQSFSRPFQTTVFLLDVKQ